MTIDDHRAEFDSKTKAGRVRYEYVEFLDVPDAWRMLLLAERFSSIRIMTCRVF
ncbi:MAG: hypothetical protein WBD74_13110 [Candidatus Aquilonibacter sp.]